MRPVLFVLLISLKASAAQIAYIGDSQSAAPYGLFEQLRGATNGFAGHTLVTGRAVCSARIENFLTRAAQHGCGNMQMTNGQVRYARGRSMTVPVSSLMSGADTVVVQLGDNHMRDPQSAAAGAAEMARQILVAGKNCVWIGPAAVSPSCRPNREAKRAVSNAIRDALARTSVAGRQCRFIDSFSVTQADPPAGDCIHFSNAAGYRAWARAIRGPLGAALSTRESAAPRRATAPARTR